MFSPQARPHYEDSRDPEVVLRDAVRWMNRCGLSRKTRFQKGHMLKAAVYARIWLARVSVPSYMDVRPGPAPKMVKVSFGQRERVLNRCMRDLIPLIAAATDPTALLDQATPTAAAVLHTLGTLAVPALLADLLRETDPIVSTYVVHLLVDQLGPDRHIDGMAQLHKECPEVGEFLDCII